MMHQSRPPVLTATAMRSADEHTINKFGIPGFTLMESAGRGTAQALMRRIGTNSSVAIYCGKGNNGGDGFVIARYLHNWGLPVHVVCLGERGSMSQDADAQYELLARLPQSRSLTLESFDEAASLPVADVYVDALLGTGLTSDVREPIRSLLLRLNDVPGLKISVDVPTGLHSDLGRPLGAAFRADVTYTMGALKTGLVLNEGPEFTGKWDVIDIGIPPFVLERPADRGEPGCAFLSSDKAIRGWMPRRGSDAHKYSVGLALVVAGSKGMTGAPVMASTAASRAGAGYVVCGCDERIQHAMGIKMTEVTTVPLPASDAGIDPQAGVEALSPRLEKAAALLVGCGLGRDPDTEAFVLRLLETADLPVVIDADGLNALVGRTELIKSRAGGRWLLTPHMGEFRRLAGNELNLTEIDVDDRIALAQHFADAWNCVLLLKGLPSVAAAPGGRAWINATGGPALANAGTGDVLAGLCVGLMAQGLDAEQAAVAGLHLGGAAADRYAATRSGRSMMATDLISEIPLIMKERLGV